MDTLMNVSTFAGFLHSLPSILLTAACNMHGYETVYHNSLLSFLALCRVNSTVM